MFTDRALLESAATRAIRYLEELPSRAVAPGAGAVARLARLDHAMPEGPTDGGAVLELLDCIGSPATVATAGGRYFGFVMGGTLPAALAAGWLAAAWDQNAGMTVASPAAAAVERVALRWVLDLLGLPGGCAVGFVTGATMANFSGLAAARHALLERAGWDVAEQGLFNAPHLHVVVGEEVHVSVLKALALLGFGRAQVIQVPADGQGRIRADRLPRLNERSILCIQAGNVHTGAFDAAHELCGAAREAGAWVHVDGAFGLWAAAAPAHAHLAAGLAEADSWAVDAHKWLNVSYDSGLAICRHPAAMRAAMAARAPYLVHRGEREPDHYTPEMSRRARGVEVWAALASLGRSGVAELVARSCRFARRFAEGLAEAGYDVLNDVVLNQVLVRFHNDEATTRVIAAIQEDGTCWCAGTVWRGQVAMRISVSSWATTPADVEKSLFTIVRLARLFTHGSGR